MGKLASLLLFAGLLFGQYFPPPSGGGGGGSPTGAAGGDLSGTYPNPGVVGRVPIGGLGAVQLYSTATAFAGDNTNLFSNLTALSSAAPVVTQGGTPGAATWGYKFIPKNLIGAGSEANATEGTTATGAAVLSTTDFNIVTSSCSGLPAGTIGNIYITTAPGGGSTGLIAEDQVCGVAYNDETGFGDSAAESLPPVDDGTVGIYVQNLNVPGRLAVGQVGLERFSLMSGNYIVTNAITGTEVNAFTMEAFLDSGSVDFGDVNGGYLAAFQRGDGDIPTARGMYAFFTHQGAGTIDEATGVYTYPALNEGVGEITRGYGLYVGSPNNDGGGVVGASVAMYAAAQANADIPNSYSFWADEQGVFRIKADNTFDAVYQAIPALYNPQFTKYTPGAVDYERIVQQWNSNIAEIGAEEGGTGTLRRLRLIGFSVEIPAILFASLGTPANATENYCSDCTVTSGADNTCAASGTGAFAHRINGVWKCFI